MINYRLPVLILVLLPTAILLSLLPGRRPATSFAGRAADRQVVADNHQVVADNHLVVADNHLVVAANHLVVADNLMVVRAYFTDTSSINQVAAWKAPWEINRDERYLVLDASEDEIRWLTGLGLRVVVDEALTTLYRQPSRPLPGQVSGIPGFPCYRTVEETYAAAEELVTGYPELASWITVGESWERTQDAGQGYELKVLRLAHSGIPEPRPILFVLSALHAREYTTAELSTRFAEYLLSQYGVDGNVTWLLDHREIHLLLQANPDGRKHAENGAYWRKNTNANYCGATSDRRGADLNRNFDFYWGCCGGSSSFECSDVYRGPSPASEPEVAAIQQYVRSVFADQRADDLTTAAPLTTTGLFLDLHSYGELVLWPWGFTEEPAPNSSTLQTLGRKLAYFNGYLPQPSIGLYPTDGTTDDYVYGTLGIPAYTFEMGTAFFQACSTFEDQILPDNLAALMYAARVADAPYQLPAGPDVVSLTLSAPQIIAGSLVTLTAEVNDTRYEERNGEEPSQPVVGAVYEVETIDQGELTTVLTGTLDAVDGLFDQPVERVTGTLDTSGLGGGRYTIIVRSQDEAANWGAPSAALLVVDAGRNYLPLVRRQ